MQIPNSIIDPCAAVAGAKYVIAFNDDDWDCWNTGSAARIGDI